MKVDLRRPRRFYGALGKCYCVTTLSKLAFVALHAIDYCCVLTSLSASFCSVVGPGFYRLSMLILLCFFLNVLQNVLCKDQLFKFKVCYKHIFIKIIYIYVKNKNTEPLRSFCSCPKWTSTHGILCNQTLHTEMLPRCCGTDVQLGNPQFRKM